MTNKELAKLVLIGQKFYDITILYVDPTFHICAVLKIETFFFSMIRG